MARIIRTRLLLLLGCVLSLAGCAGDGNFTIFGYSTKPNYDTNIRTIYVPIFENRTFYRGLEFELHTALQTALHTRTPYRITSNREAADTVLEGKITGFQRNLVLINPNNGQRAEETILTVAVVWKDLRSGEVLSRRQRRPGEPVPLDLPPPGGPTLLPGVALPSAPVAPTPFVQDAGGPAIEARPAAAPPPSEPIVINTTATYHPELGESITIARQKATERMAVQITNMMQVPW